MFYDPLSVSNEEENAQNILCINDHRQWASPMFTINVNQALRVYSEHSTGKVFLALLLGVHRNQFFKFRPEPDPIGTRKKFRPEVQARTGTD
jgi:hypothetical protein